MAELETNTLLINNVSSVSFKIFKPIDRHSFELRAPEIENALRSRGHVVCCDGSLRSLWIFRLPGQHGGKLDNMVVGGWIRALGHNLALVEDGVLEAANLPNGRFTPGAINLNTPTSSSATAMPIPEHPHRSQAGPGAPSHAPPSHAPPNTADQAAATKPPSTTGTDAKPQTSVSLKEAYEYFVTAILALVSPAFCRRLGAIPLNYRTVLLHPDFPGPEHSTMRYWVPCAALAVLRIHLTTAGSLLFGLSLVPVNGLSPIADSSVTNPATPPAAGRVVVAPFGMIARGYGFRNDDPAGHEPTSAKTQQNAQLSRLRHPANARPSQWRRACIDVLGFRGMSSALIQTSSWEPLQILRYTIEDQISSGRRVFGSTYISWPSILCFKRRTIPVPPLTKSGGMFLADEWDATYNPFEHAAELASLQAEREKIKEEEDRKARKGKAAADQPKPEPTPPTKATGGSLVPLRPNGSTPMVWQKPSHAVIGAVYPTPPDGVQNPAAGVTPTTEDLAPSPADAAAHGPSGAGRGGGAGHSPAGVSDPLVDRRGPGLRVEKAEKKMPFLDEEDEDIFDDLKAAAFGDFNVTDADFNFFDSDAMGDAPAESSLNVAEEGQRNNRKPRQILPPPTPDTPGQPDPTTAPPVPVPEKPKPRPEAVVAFAKPQLRHARSMNRRPKCPSSIPRVVEENPSAGKKESPGLGPPPAAKRDPSPFGPDAVYEKVCASLSLSAPVFQGPGRRDSVFAPVNLGPSLPVSGQKYEQTGYFGYVDRAYAANARIEIANPFSTPSSNRRKASKEGKRPGDLPDSTVAFIRKLTGASGDRTGDATGEDGSDEDDGSPGSSPARSPPQKRIHQINFEDGLASQGTSARENDGLDDMDVSLATELPLIYRSDGSGESVVSGFEEPAPLNIRLPIPDESFIAIAQLVTAQVAFGSLDVRAEEKDIIRATVPPPGPERRRRLAVCLRRMLDTLKSVIPASLGEPSGCTLRALLDVQDVPLTGQPNRPQQARPVPGRDANPDLRLSNLYPISPPHIEVRRYDSAVSLLPTAVHFWELLGLSPTRGTKDVVGVFVYPGWDGMALHVRMFLDRIQTVYLSHKLGAFDRLEIPGSVSDGLAPYDVDKPSTMSVPVPGSGALTERLEAVGHALFEANPGEKTVVVFLTFSSKNLASILAACTAFQHLVETQRQAWTRTGTTPPFQIALQLIPIERIGLPSTMVVQPPKYFAGLCRETYERCFLFTRRGPVAAPTLRLEQPPPRMIDFKLTMEPVQSLLQENSCVHVAYAQSVNQRWITAAWTDSQGSRQATASYCTSRMGKQPWPASRTSIFQAIWERTYNIIASLAINWRIIVTKCGSMGQQESEIWAGLAQTETRASVSLTLLTVDTNPALQLLPPIIRLPPEAVFGSSAAAPPPSALSPEQSENGTSGTAPGAAHSPQFLLTPESAPSPAPGKAAANPSTEPEPGTVLVDLADYTWGAVLAHRLSNSESLRDVRPALVSGYLIKRGGVYATDPPMVMEVNAIHSDVNPRAYEQVLREVLWEFRGLGTLARAKGVVDDEADVRPWHVAAAEKGVRALYMLM